MKRFLVVALAVVGVVGVGFFVMKGYSEPWTGFGPFLDREGKLQPAKTLWDWLDLLIVPVFLAGGAWFLDKSRKVSEARVEADRQRQATLDQYLEAIADMLLKSSFASTSAVKDAKEVARTRTLAALRSLDGGRKAQVLQFLHEAGLISSSPLVQLNGADLNDAQLDEAVLRNAELRGVYFQRASLRNATLVDADFRGCDFTEADFTGANVTGTNFVQANLKKARITPEMLKLAKTA